MPVLLMWSQFNSLLLPLRAALTHVLLKLLINIYFLTLGAIINSYRRDMREREPIKEYGREILE